MFSGFALGILFRPFLCPAGHCINVTLSYMFVSGSYGPTAGKNPSTAYSSFLFRRTDRIAFSGGQEELDNIFVPLMREFILFTFNLWIHNEGTCAVFIVHF